MKIPLFHKILMGYVLVIAALAGLVLAVSFSLIRAQFVETLDSQLAQKARLLAPDLIPAAATGDVDGIRTLLKNAASHTPERFTVIDTEGRVLGDTQADPLSMENHRDRPEFMRALNGEAGNSIRPSHTLGEELLYVAIPLKDGERVVGALRLSLPLKDVGQVTRRLRVHIATVVLLLAALSLVGAFFLARHLSGPVRALSEASRRLAEGNFETRLFLQRRDELQDLAEGFNAMASRLEALFRESALKTEELRHVLDALQDGLLAVDASGNLILANPVFCALAGRGDLLGRPYWEALRDPDFTDLVRENLKARSRGDAELAIGDRTLRCAAAPLEEGGGLVVLLHDITQERRLEAMKRDFVVNVSHELRTPLTAISGFVETLEEGADEDQHRYIEIIQKHTRRLSAIVQDLLTLSELEERGFRLRREPVRLRALVEGCAKIFEPRLKEKGLDLRLGIPETLPTVDGDPYKLEQVFVNLIDNAVKYTESGSIAVDAEPDGDRLRVRVRDTGIGIPREHLPRLFERFYVVDKSRSRQVSGTGLGLSIVKHIVQLHGGTIEVESAPGRGSTFTILLPASNS
jgi:two-component system phosphate regulon sensor histidine kinase PhoR